MYSNSNEWNKFLRTALFEQEIHVVVSTLDCESAEGAARKEGIRALLRCLKYCY